VTQQAKQQKQWANIIAKTWADDDYKARLIAEPKVVLAEEGVELDDDLDYAVVEAAENQVVLVLPSQRIATASPGEVEERRAAIEQPF